MLLHLYLVDDPVSQSLYSRLRYLRLLVHNVHIKVWMNEPQYLSLESQW